MKKVKVTHVNRFDISFQIETYFVKVDDFGNKVNDWFIDNYNVAKMILYSGAKESLTKEQEEKGIAEILSVGVEHYLNDDQ